MFKDIKTLVYDKDIKQDQIVIYQKAIQFLYEKEYVYMYSFNDALKEAKNLIFNYKMNINQLNQIRYGYEFWTSREQTFLTKRDFVYNIAKKSILGDEKDRYRLLKQYYYSYRSNDQSRSLKDRREILNHAYDRVVKSNLSEKKLRFEMTITSWISSEFIEIFNFKSAKRKFNYYKRKRINKETFDKLREAFYEFRRKGSKPKSALRKAERKIFGFSEE